MLHVWLVPALAVFFLVIAIFYLAIKTKGGSGTRTAGRTVVDKPEDDEDPPPG